MYRNGYDSDVITFSPLGRIHQVEYAKEAVKQGSAAIGLRSNTHAIIVGLKRSSGDLATYQKKIHKIDDHIGIGIAGLTSDARVLSNYMRSAAMSSQMAFSRPLSLKKIVDMVAGKAQKRTHQYVDRPYGVGLLVAGYDETGPHLFENTPEGTGYEYHAMAIGARSQSAKTYLENNYEKFADASLDELVLHGLQALRDTLQQDQDLNIENTTLGIVGKDPESQTFQKFKIIEDEELKHYIDLLGEETGKPRRAEGEETAPESATTSSPDVAPMDTE